MTQICRKRGQDGILDMLYPKPTINYRRERANNPFQITQMRPSNIACTYDERCSEEVSCDIVAIYGEHMVQIFYLRNS